VKNMGEVIRPKRTAATMGSILAAWTGICIVVGAYGSMSLPIGGYVSGFWPAMALQAIGGMWFGMWGVIVAFLFPIISDAIGEAIPMYVAATLIPANFFQAWTVAWVFRRFKLNPELKTRKDWLAWILVGCILQNAIGATLGTTAFVLWGLFTWEAQPLFWAGWFVGNTWPAIVFGSLILKIATPFVKRTRVYVFPDWW
jgi:hypothetical protein